jgi:hypothetical protein
VALGALSAAVLALLALSASASAKQITPYAFDRFFDGTGSTAGAFTSGIKRVEINQSNNRVYTLEDRGSEILISQFDENGASQLWTGLGGVSSFTASSGTFASDLAVDNTGHGGGFYVQGAMGSRSLRAFNYDGSTRIESFGWTGNRCRVDVGPNGVIWQGDGQVTRLWNPNTGLQQLAPDDSRLFEQQPCNHFFDAEEHVYLSKETGQGGVYKYVKQADLRAFEDTWEGFGDHSKIRFSYFNTPNATIDQAVGLVYAIELGTRVQVYSTEGQPLTSFGLGEGEYNGLLQATGIAVNEDTGEVYVTSRRSGAQPAGKESPVSPRVDVFKPQTPITVPDATTGDAGHPSKTSAILNGVVNADGVATTECKFEWGTTTRYLGGSVPCDQGNVFTGSTDTAVTYELKSLTLGTTYHYRVAAKNTNGTWSYGVDETFEASVAPEADAVIVDRVNTDGARFSTEVTPNGGTTNYYFEVGEQDCASNPCTKVPASPPTLESNLTPEDVTQTTIGLTPDTPYFARLVAENGAGKAVVPFQFRTYPSPPGKDDCANALVRQQTGAFLLPDCRAYELVSAANAGGYDVESDLVPGQTPFSAYSDASDRALYGLHFGSVPGIAGSPTNHGLDPYIAERGANGWTTRYVGVPADGMTDVDPFGSPLLGADAGLDTFAFGGPDICDPCFDDGSTNIPLRLPNGQLVQGMAGDLNPAADPVGEVREPLSEDGSHFVFGADVPFVAGGNSGSVSIYDRNLATGTTQIVSRLDDGSVMTGDVAQLAISDDGNRILVGKLVGTDSAGNRFFDLYMHVGTDPETVEVADTANGVSFSGMTSDGSMVFFTTGDQLAGDTDTSVDVFRADVSPGGAVVSRLSAGAGGTGNTDSCNAPGFPESWNSVAGDGKCNVVAFAGGAGAAADDGSFYFVSPEQLDGASGLAGQANLYVAQPGQSLQFVETIDSSLVKPGPPPDVHPLETNDFTGETHSTPEAVAVDQSTGDVYVYETGNGKLARYTSAGAPENFGAVQPYIEGNRVTGLPAVGNSQSQVAVDNTPGSPFNGDIYVTSDPTVTVLAPNGEKLGSISGTENIAGTFGIVCGVAVDPNSGALYIGDREFEVIWQYTPKAGATAPITDSDYEVKALVTSGHAGCNVAADSSGHVYSSRFANGPIRSFEEESFAAPVGSSLGTQFNTASRSVTVDPTTDEVYVQEGNAVKIFNSSLELVTTFGQGDLSGSRGIALNTTSDHAYATGAVNVLEFGREQAPFHPIGNPAVINGVKDADIRRTSDFQVTPNGDFAVFASSLSLTGFQNLGHYEIYRYEPGSGELECASCATTGAAATSDTTLVPHGLAVSDNGKVYFTSSEGLVLSDTNGKKDAYQWSGGTQLGLLSSGKSIDDSSLLSVSRDGTNAFFFTREVLVPSDENGGAVKIYTARVGGGYQQFVTRQPCAAADECHGPGTQAPPPPNINSITGPGQLGETPPDCAALRRRAQQSRALAKRLRRKVRQLGGSGQARSTRRKAGKAANRARKLSGRARACERSSGGNG